jgi:FtsZ-binding cell division protein ZapB
MKRTILTFGIAFTAYVAFASNASDSICTCLSKIQAADATIETLKYENKDLKDKVISLSQKIEAKDAVIDSLKSELTTTVQSISALSHSLKVNITSTRGEIQSSFESLNNSIAKKSQTGLWIFCALALALIIVAFILGKLIAKRGNEVASLSAKADKLNEEIVNRMASEVNDMQIISKQISSLSNTPGASPESEQKLITTLADRITFMEMTLYKMDSSVRGHKQLSKSIKQMKDNLLANGYELVDMLGKDYHDGMKVTANFVEDEELPQGKQVITGIIKPQINYKGKMIQSAQITVSQNI